MFSDYKTQEVVGAIDRFLTLADNTHPPRLVAQTRAFS